jgi:hypothetical protein
MTGKLHLITYALIIKKEYVSMEIDADMSM